MAASTEPRPGWPYFFLRGFFRTTYSLFLGLTLEGRENVPRSGPAVLMPNHESHLDPYLVTFASFRPLAYIGKEELFRGFGGWLFPRMNCGMVKRGTGDVSAFRFAARVLGRGGLFVVYPEGTRSRSGQLGPVQPGAVSIALRARVPIIPIGIVGTREALLADQKVLRRHPVGMRIGRPIHFARRDPRDYRDKALVAHVGEQVMAEIATLRRGLRHDLGLPEIED